VSSDALSGGLLLLWRGDVTVAIQSVSKSVSKSHIDVVLLCLSLSILPICHYKSCLQPVCH
jgi:hypothetical protein